MGRAAAWPVRDHGSVIRTRIRRAGSVVFACVVATLVVACGGTGGASGSTSTASAVDGGSGQPSASPSQEVTMTDFVLTTSAFAPGGAIPRQFTCDGEDTSPDLSWTGAPDGTAAFVLVVDDPTANGFVHWIAYDLTGSDSGGLAVGVSSSPDAPPQGTNDFGNIGWSGPCPPSGEHRYRFTLSALAAPLELEGAPRIGDLRRALDKASVLGTATIEGTYRRG
jgi:Raf kinase inhibitor-like YbhB/YbcL family protein